jgi:hypothetical protein
VTLDAGLPDVQSSDEFRMQNTWSLFAGMYEKFGLLVPALMPFTFHK